jgi:hypothetical protein
MSNRSRLANPSSDPFARMAATASVEVPSSRRAMLVSCPGVARLHLPRRDQDHQLAVRRRQFAVETEIVFQGANTIGELRHVHQHAKRTTYPAAHGGDAVPDGLVLEWEVIPIWWRQAAHAGGKRIRVRPTQR